MKALHFTAALLTVVWFGIASAQADELDLAMTTDNWQQNRLLAPTAAQRAQEERGTVVIYQGLRDVEVEKALDAAFDRLEYMMFVDTVVTDENGEPVTDPQSGEVVTESDDC